MLQIGRSLVRSQLVLFEFFIDIKSFRSHYGPGVDSPSNRNEYQEHFHGGKGSWCVRLTTLPPSCAFVMKSRNFKFLEQSGPLQACNGTELPLILFSPVIVLPPVHHTHSFIYHQRCIILGTDSIYLYKNPFSPSSFSLRPLCPSGYPLVGLLGCDLFRSEDTTASEESAVLFFET